ncbi:hypothetical protein IFM89_031932 [Coptis chinensis]|uniref:DUF7135 domain-containing protein n=1 Tax=Coptis chinensis TaxID=261450 RepID=A0A835IVV5_9MAGN|nr:hypothetical protein IFM89_031932 [Coptis chinensis]
MGASSSREGLEISDSETESDSEEQQEENYQDVQEEDSYTTCSPSSLADIDAKLKSLKLKYSSSSSSTQNPPNLKNPVKLYLHIGGNTPKAKWITSEKLTTYSFTKSSNFDNQESDDEDEDEDEDEGRI